jgi:hypothetical protein
MEPLGFAKQMIDFYKAAFDNTFNAMVMLQEQMDKVSGIALQQASWLPEEGVKAINEWTESYKKGREEFRSAVDTNFAKVEEFFAQAGK